MDRFEASLTEQGRYRLLVEAITDYAIYMLDASGHITSWNRGAQRFKGYEAAEVIGRHYSMFHTLQDRDAGVPERALQRSAEAGTFESEGWRLRKDGSRFWAHVVIDPIHDETGGLMGFAKVTRDITERREAEQALKQSQEQFRLLVQSVTDYAIYQLDANGLINTWNTGAERIKGYRAEEVVGRHVSLFYTEDDRTKGEPERSLRIAAQDGRYAREGWRVRKDGSLFMASVLISVIRNGSDTVIGFAAVTRDMTDAKNAQLELERAREALFQSQKMEAVGQLTGGVAHDFNNILMAVLGGLEVIYKRLPHDPNITPLLKNAMRAAQRGKLLTRRMLTYARRQELRPEAVSLPVVIQGMMDMLQRALGPSMVIEAHFPQALAQVHVDPRQLELVLLNLAMNARDAMPDGGSIIIGAGEETIVSDQTGISKPGQFVRLSMIDKGDGMDEITLSRAIEPFFTTKGVGKGTGLGLSMAQGFAEQTGGKFVLKSRLGEGTVAELWLPVATGAEPRFYGGMETVVAEHIQGRIGGPRQVVVLAVDDDRLALMNTTSMLNSLGHRVFTATSGQQALSLIRRERLIDLVIVDHAMSGMSAAELAEAIRLEWPTLPIIFATPLDDAGLYKLAKPFCKDDLANAIAHANTIRPFQAMI